MFKHQMEIVHNHGNGFRDWLFYWNVFPQRESTIEGLFRSLFTEL